MAQYVDKSALVAEIERLRKNQRLDDRHNQGVLDGLHAIEKFINTLEVRDVDVEKLSWKDIRLIAEIGEEWMNSEESDPYANDEEGYYTAILNKLKEKGLNYKTQRQRIRDIQAQKGE